MGRTGKLIVLADDEDDLTRALAELIEDMTSHRVVVARNGQEALDRILALRPDIAILDLQMARMDGIEVAQRLRKELGANCPLLIAHTGGGNLALAVRMSVFDHAIEKPIDIEHLLQYLA